MHVHGSYAEMVVIVDLLPDSRVRVANRKDAIRPANGSKADARQVLAVAAEHYSELVTRWEKHHG